MQSDFQRVAEELYQSGLDDGFRSGFINVLKKALEEATLSAAEPVPCEGCDGHNCDDGCAYPTPASKPAAEEYPHPEWIWYCESDNGPVVTFGRWAKNPQQRRYKLAEIQPTEHDHPAPSVTMKTLHQAASDFMHLFIQDGHLTVQSLEDTDLIPAYEKLSAALSAQVQDVAESKPIDLNITKEWFEKRAALEGDHEIGAGSRKKTICIDPTPDELTELFRIAHRIPEGWQLVPKEPTHEMLRAMFEAMFEGILYDGTDAPMIGAAYDAALAAALAKQEG